MDNRDLYTRLKAIKAEILAMKQSHDYGLGRTDLVRKWWQIDYSPSVSGVVTIVVVFTDNITQIPFFQIFGLDDVDEVIFSGHTLTIKTNVSSLGYLDCLLTISAPIVSASLEVI